MTRTKRSNSAWIRMRNTHLITYPECRACEDVNRSNHVHHLCYRGARGKSERPGDLITLCEYHHMQLHRELGRPGPSVERQLEWINIARHALLSVDAFG